MTVPKRIPIRHNPTHRTSTIGGYEGGYFFGWVTGAFVPGETRGADWASRKRWYAVLHRFDHDGAHTTSDIWCPGSGIRYGQQDRLAQWLDALPGRVYGDIAIRPFRVEVDAIVFGLVPERHSEHPEDALLPDWAEFYPGRLGFSAPWDGTYDT